MSEPDEALLWARERAATECDEDGFPIFADDHRAGKHDHFLTREARAYRAGQAASAERIKALEEEIDAARIEGIRLGLEAAAREAVNWAVMPANFDDAIRALDPATIAKEADQ